MTLCHESLTTWRVRVRHDIKLEYITSELLWSCIRGQQLGVVEAEIVDGGSPVSLHARERGLQKNLVQRSGLIRAREVGWTPAQAALDDIGN